MAPEGTSDLHLRGNAFRVCKTAKRHVYLLIVLRERKRKR